MFQDFDQLLHATARLHADLQLDIDTSDPDLGVALLSMADRRMFATVRADRAHCFTLFCDVGAIDPARMPAMCQHLLEANTLLADRGWGCWCIEPRQPLRHQDLGEPLWRSLPCHRRPGSA